VNANQWIEVLSSLPEIQALLECGHRSGVRFGLRGSVIRNLVLSEGQDFGKYDSLYDFVDAFGDIDVVALNESDQNSLARILYQTVPFADFHIWDFGLAREAEKTAIRRGVVAADQLVLWFDGRGDERLRLGAFEGSVADILGDPSRLRRGLNLRADTGNAIGDLLQAVKAARVQLQVVGKPRTSAREFGDELGHLGERLRSWTPGRRQSLWRGRVSRLEIELAQLILNAADWPQTLKFLGQMKDSISGEWLSGSEPLGMMLSGNPERSARLGMALYRPQAGASYRFEVTTSAAEEEATSNQFRSRIPWTRLTLQNPKESSCCPYSDFEEGIGVIAWRSSGGERTRKDQELRAQDYGVVGRPAVGARQNVSGFDDDHLIPMSGYTRKGRSIAIRLDPAYLKLITGGRYSTFLVGLLPTSSAGDVEVFKPRHPSTSGPGGDVVRGRAGSAMYRERTGSSGHREAKRQR